MLSELEAMLNYSTPEYFVSELRSSKQVLPLLYLQHLPCRGVKCILGCSTRAQFTSSPSPSIVWLTVVIGYNGQKSKGPLQLVLRAEVSVGGTVEL